MWASGTNPSLAVAALGWSIANLPSGHVAKIGSHEDHEGFCPGFLKLLIIFL